MILPPGLAGREAGNHEWSEIMPDIWPAKGHVAKILVFSEDSVMLPLSEREASRLHFALTKQFDRLKETGDFPEQEEYENLLSNLSSVVWLLSPAERQRR